MKDFEKMIRKVAEYFYIMGKQDAPKYFYEEKLKEYIRKNRRFK